MFNKMEPNIQPYHFIVHHHKGRSNANADSLSKKESLEECCEHGGNEENVMTFDLKRGRVPKIGFRGNQKPLIRIAQASVADAN